MKQVINADEYQFEIRKHKLHGHALYVNHPSFSCERTLVYRWTISECRNYIFTHFIGEKGTHFNINVVE